jgi:hypothetical protein
MERKRDLKHFRDLEAYQRAFNAAMQLFEITKSFPSEERFSMVDQVRRSSRSVCSNLAEGWRKRRYEAVFRSKKPGSKNPALICPPERGSRRTLEGHFNLVPATYCLD